MSVVEVQAPGLRARARVRLAEGGDQLEPGQARGDRTLRNRLRAAETDRGPRPGLTVSERERLKELERENRELWRANQVLKAAAAFFGWS